jgi:hypothetical protein
MQRPVGEEIKENGKAPRQTRHEDPVVCLLLREVQDLHTVREEGRKSLGEVQAPILHLHEMQDDLARHSPRLRDETIEAFEKLVVGERLKRELGFHAIGRARSFGDALNGTPGRGRAGDRGLRGVGRDTAPESQLALTAGVFRNTGRWEWPFRV